jgi:hypothetical protein
MNAPADKKQRPRSPEFPFVPLREAIERTEQLIAANQRHPARVKSLAPLWDYSESSSSFLRTIAALRAFGLADETGSKEDRKISVSELGMKIVKDERKGAKEAAIARAFENCIILFDFYQRWGAKRPADSVCISELTLDHGFTDVAARKFISVYDDTVSFVEQVTSGGGESDQSASAAPNQHSLDVGMFVQWEQAGTLQLERPAKLVGFSADGKFAFVEGSAAGIPRGELIPVNVAPQEAEKGQSSARSPQPLPRSNMVEATYPVAEGICTLIYPVEMSEKSAKRLKRWLDLMLEDVAELAGLTGKVDGGAFED